MFNRSAGGPLDTVTITDKPEHKQSFEKKWKLMTSWWLYLML